MTPEDRLEELVASAELPADVRAACWAGAGRLEAVGYLVWQDPWGDPWARAPYETRGWPLRDQLARLDALGDDNALALNAMWALGASRSTVLHAKNKMVWDRRERREF